MLPGVLASGGAELVAGGRTPATGCAGAPRWKPVTPARCERSSRKYPKLYLSLVMVNTSPIVSTNARRRASDSVWQDGRYKTTITYTDYIRAF
eukprot:6192713-Pleurochrysis_carterae.AAC.1